MTPAPPDLWAMTPWRSLSVLCEEVTMQLSSETMALFRVPSKLSGTRIAPDRRRSAQGQCCGREGRGNFFLFFLLSFWGVWGRRHSARWFGAPHGSRCRHRPTGNLVHPVGWADGRRETGDGRREMGDGRRGKKFSQKQLCRGKWPFTWRGGGQGKGGPVRSASQVPQNKRRSASCAPHMTGGG